MSDPPSRERTREASRLFHVGVALLPLTAAVLILGLELGVTDGVYCAFLLTTLPVLGIAQLPLLEDAQIERLGAYLSSAIMILVLAAVALVLGALGPGLAELGLRTAPLGTVAWTTGLVVAGVVALGVASHLVERWLDIQESPVLKALIPRTTPEKGLFAVLSLTAGVGEEIVYRGYLLAILVPVFSEPLTAALVASMAFGLLHAYQGPFGIVRTGVLGLLFALVFLNTGLLWPLILTHIAVDLVSGLILGPAMNDSRA